MENQEENQESGWHLKKEVSIGQIVAIATVAIGLITSWSQMDKRVTVLESEVIHSREADQRLETQLRESVTRIEAAVVRIEQAMREKADKR